ncbi:DNA polymerase beta superfamily protein [Clostridium botulinum]|uniref:DNA polymerase beta superfamily protein n=1 Tax=Clostridium botulinum TaxID=1491 RepID=UPI0007742630|nr:nucleotidyltransferase domain-containing protein [Clostridium botulinum]APH20950.1 putative nucleotidyltransferase family protein [Clostridium botulinum]APQ71186.1 putative nucleotidyltransferase family protein [Clostridium botulinum]MBN3379059.1 nucleotidyltransferase [Clostridium botulinum]
MNIQDIKQKLNSKEYDFLRNNEHLGNNIILLTTGGSHAYGTNVESSDLDIRGIATERIEELIGLSSFEQFENKETDTTIYALNKVIKLMLNCNPNTIELLGTKDEHLFICNKHGKLLRDNVNLFLSKKAIHSFGGYATAQLRRLQNALARDSYPQSEKEQHILNSIKNQMVSFEDRYKKITNKNINLYIDKSKKEDLENEIFMNIDLNNYPLRDFKNIYSEMSNIVKDYGKLNHRNSKKDELHLNKHALHLIRLLKMGTELLEGKGINTYRDKDRELLLNIRNGKYSYKEIFEMVDKYEKDFKYASDNTNLPNKPKYKEVEELVIEINKGVINND